MGNIKAVVFDMDGVLVEAKDWHYEALNRALNLYGMNISREEHLETYDGLPTKTKLHMLSEACGLGDTLHPVINKLKQMYTLDLVDVFCKPTDYHLHALKSLKQDGFKTAVASNSVRKSVEVMMEKTGLTPYLDVLLSNEDVEKPKPHPDIYLKAAELLNLSPSECLVVEDNKNGIAAAKAAGTCVMEVVEITEVNYDNIRSHIEKFNQVAI